MNTIGNDSLARTVGARLRAARLAAKLPATSVAEQLGYQGQTQVSLAESGNRIPPLPVLMAYADLYAVPLDFLCGRIDDPIADSAETNQGVIVNVLAEAMHEQFSKLVSSVAEQASITIAGYNQDRCDLKDTCSAAARARAALKRVRELNPEFDDDWRGTATLVREIDTLASTARNAKARLDREQRLRDTVDQQLSLDDMSSRARQGIVQLTLTAEKSVGHPRGH